MAKKSGDAGLTLEEVQADNVRLYEENQQLKAQLAALNSDLSSVDMEPGLGAIVAEKLKLGLSKADAINVAKSQLRRDAEIAAEEKKK